MSSRRAPASGYDFGSKRQYRRNIWRIFREACQHELSSAQVMLMPSAECDEVEVALSSGFKMSNLHLVDDNPAIVAWAKRRYPQVHTYGVDVAEAAARSARNGVMWRTANIDLCGFIGKKQLSIVTGVAISGVFNDGSVVAVTMLRGRERGLYGQAVNDPPVALFERLSSDPASLFQSEHFESEQEMVAMAYNAANVMAADGVSNADRMRIAATGTALMAGMANEAVLIRCGSYRSTSPMLWAIFFVAPFVSDFTERQARLKNRLRAMNSFAKTEELLLRFAAYIHKNNIRLPA